MKVYEDMPCYEAIAGVDEAMRGAIGTTNYYVLGGIVSSAIRHPATVFDHGSEEIQAPMAASENVVRPNGTLRDIDILVDDILDEEHAKEVVAAVEEAVKGNLVVSVFGFDSHEITATRSAAQASFADWTSRRTIDGNGARRYELFPLAQVVPDSTYSPWQLRAENGATVSALHPAGHVLAYGLRSISGVRNKDTEKLGQMLDRVLMDPECKAAITEGDFKSWLQFATDIYDLRDGTGGQDISFLQQRAFRFKGKLLGLLESNERIVKLAQDGPIQDALKYFVHAQ